MQVFAEPKLESGQKITISLFSKGVEPMVFLHADFLSSQRPIADSKYRVEGNELYLFTDVAFTSIKLTFADETSCNEAAEALDSMGVSCNNTEPHGAGNPENVETLHLKGTGDITFSHLNDAIGVVTAPSFEYVLLLDTASPQAFPPFEDKVQFGLTSKSRMEQTHATFFVDREHYNSLVTFWKGLRFPMHGAVLLND